MLASVVLVFVASADAISLAVAAVTEAVTGRLGAGAGGLRSLRRAAGWRSWDLAARADVLLMYEALTHFSADDPAPGRGLTDATDDWTVRLIVGLGF